MNEYLVARHALISEGVEILTESNEYLLLKNKHGVVERVGNNADDILAYCWGC